MNIVIKYCVRWNYFPQASSLAATIQKKLQIEPNLIQGERGIFDVSVDGKLIFSKHQENRFPEHQEILKSLGLQE